MKSAYRLFLAFSAVFLLLNISSQHNTEAQNSSVVYVIKIDGSINPSTSDFIHKSITEAVSKNAECLIIQLNTPGGLLKSTRYIVSDLLTSEIPTVVFVSPSGSQAASAGVFVTIASNIAAMAPGTNIGASHPVSTGGQMDSVMSEKTTNDAAAFIRSISEKRKRNIQWSEDAVRKSVSISETEALNLKVIDLVANDVNDLLQKIDGKEVETSKGKKILNTKNASIVNFEMSWFEQFLSLVSDPNISYILMLLGIWGIILEFYHPGAVLPGVAGGICILLALYGLHTLPINYAGLALIVLAIIIFIADIKVTSHGVLTVGGIICLLIGSFMLIDTSSGFDSIRISKLVMITTSFVVGGLFAFLAYLVLKARRRKIVSGIPAMIGELGEVLDEISGSNMGAVKFHGEIWNAFASLNPDEKIEKGSKVKVVDVKDLALTVQKV